MNKIQKILILKQVARNEMLKGLSLGMSVSQAKELALNEVAYLNMHPIVMQDRLEMKKRMNAEVQGRMECLVDEISNEIKLEKYKKKTLLLRMRDMFSHIVQRPYDLKGGDVCMFDLLSVLAYIISMVFVFREEDASQCCLMLMFGSGVAGWIAGNKILKTVFAGMVVLTLVAYFIILYVQQ